MPNSGRWTIKCLCAGSHDQSLAPLGIPEPARGRLPATGTDTGTFAASADTVFVSCAGGQVTLTGRILQSGYSTVRCRRTTCAAR